MTKDFKWKESPLRSFPLYFCMILTCKTKTTTKAESVFLNCDTLPFHTHFQPAVSTPARPVSCHSFPAAVTPVRPVSLLGDRVITPSTHTHFLHLFIYLFVSLRFLVSAIIPSVSCSTLLTHPCCHSRTSCLRCWISPVYRSTLYFQ